MTEEIKQLSEALDAGLATLSLIQPEGWRDGGFAEVQAWLAPECPALLGEPE
jgi:hypothetical protein